MMSQRSFPVKDAVGSLLRDRIYTVEDESVGTKLDEFRNDKFPTHTPDGFEFLVQTTLESRDVRNVCEQFLVRPYLGFIKIFGSKLPSDYVYRFLPGSLEPINAIAILICSPDSEFVFWNGSAVIGIKKENVDMALKDDENTCIEEDEEDKAVSRLWGLLAGKEHRFRELGACGIPAVLKAGGLVLADCRLGFQIRQGYAVFLGFATQSQVRSWGQMKMAYSEPMRDKFEELKRRGYHINYTWL